MGQTPSHASNGSGAVAPAIRQQVVDEYVFTRVLGNGAFGVVFLAHHRKRQDQKVAIKQVKRQGPLLSWQKEVKILQQLATQSSSTGGIAKCHENLLLLLEVMQSATHVYLVMEYCNGGDLADLLAAAGGTFPEDVIRIIVKQMASAIKALNDKGIVHRDLKPANILVSYDEKRFARGLLGLNAKELANAAEVGAIRVKIADFGLARFLPNGVLAATWCGTPAYMAPEVLMSQRYDAKADLWSLGAIVFECLTGRLPFPIDQDSPVKLFRTNWNLRLNIPSGASPAIADLVSKLLKRSASQRISIDEMLRHAFLLPNAPLKRYVSPARPAAAHELRNDAPMYKKFVVAANRGPVEAATPPLYVSHRNAWYVLGGDGARRQLVSYDPLRRLWTTLPDLPWERTQFGVCRIANRIVAIGGYKDAASKFGDIDAFDITKSTWSTQHTRLKQLVDYMAACSDSTAAAYVLGGGPDGRAAFKYCPLSDIVEEIAPMMQRNVVQASIFHSTSNSIFVAGGSYTFDVIDKYDCRTNAWSHVGKMHKARCRMSTTFVGNDLYMVGGQESFHSSSTTNVVEIFDTNTGVVRRVQNMLSARRGSRGVTLDNNIVCVLGGATPSSAALSSVETFDVREGRWTSGVVVPDMPMKCSYFGLACLQ